MLEDERMNRMLAIPLWGIASCLLGATGGVWLGWSGRELIFPSATAFGIYLFVLFSLWRKKDQTGEVASSGPKEIGAGEGGWLSPEELSLSGKVLEADQARQWLDDFLVKQQSK